MNNFKEKANFLWSIADLLRGHYKQADYGKVILPLTVLRRLDFVLEPTKKKVLEAYEANKGKKYEILEPILNNAAKAKFHNRSKFDFNELAKDHNNIAANLRNYLNGFSISAKEIIDYFSFDDQIKKLDEYDLLFMIIEKFAKAGDMFKNVSTLEMGYIFEELIRKFAELSNETAGEHFTPREVIRLMVNLLFVNDKDILRKKGIVKTLYDPACGTGGMLSIAEEYLQELNPDAKLEVFGQELNPESYAICKSDMLIKGQNPANIKFGNSFTQDGLEDETFDYMLSNPPFGVEWKKAEKQIKDEYANKGFAGRFGAGLPAISDGSFLFLQHMISKMKRSSGGSRIGIVFNGSPLFSGGAGSGTSDIRKWIIENDMLEAIIAMPDQLFYNTGISTYVWIVTDRKEKERKGKVQLINATGSDKDDKDNPFYSKMLRSLGNKRKEIHEQAIKRITEIYGDGKETHYCKIFDNDDFGYHRITVERPRRNEKGKITIDKKGNPIPDADLRDSENVPLKEDVEKYFIREVLPHLPDAWIDHSKTKIGYEINFTKYFYIYKPLRSLLDIRKDILALEEETEGMIKEVIK
ncbi:MAG: class I SAM-dependent DNA methyltransferase [Bacteroidia bacterium]|nr:class I SAM-dependent DNA methyltransferase [Bacteroidia bacterium]